MKFQAEITRNIPNTHMTMRYKIVLRIWLKCNKNQTTF